MTKPVRPDDPVWRAIEAAEGWRILGLAQAAWEELDALHSTYRNRPAFLHEQARVLVALGRVREAKETVRRLALLAPVWRLTLLDDPALDPVWM